MRDGMEQAIRVGLKGEEIPLSARIMEIADVFDALISERCYKKALTQSLQMLFLRLQRRGNFQDVHELKYKNLGMKSIDRIHS